MTHFEKMIEKDLEEQLGIQVRSWVHFLFMSQVNKQVWQQVEIEVKQQVGYQVRNQSIFQINDRFWGSSK